MEIAIILLAALVIISLMAYAHESDDNKILRKRNEYLQEKIRKISEEMLNK